jgi:hypothetical protein
LQEIKPLDGHSLQKPILACPLKTAEKQRDRDTSRTTTPVQRLGVVLAHLTQP